MSVGFLALPSQPQAALRQLKVFATQISTKEELIQDPKNTALVFWIAFDVTETEILTALLYL